MVIIKITGGLGNQLFQYGFGKLLENKNFEIKFDIQTEVTAKNFTERKLDLQKFTHSLAIATSGDVQQYIRFPSGLLWRAERKLSQLLRLNSRYYVQKNAHARAEKLKDGTYYDGYWQLCAYMDDVREILLREIIPDQNFFEKYRQILTELGAENSVSIHVRRGDYIHIAVNRKIFEVCEIDYYEDAIKYMKAKLLNPKFYIFTQDIEWAEENFSGSEFQVMKGGSAIEDMMLMSKCKNNIIANSTFSWWSAWLNTNAAKLVVAPKKWYKNSELNGETQNLIPRNWIRI